MSAPRAPTASLDPARNRPAGLAATVGAVLAAVGGGLTCALILASTIGVAGAVALGASSLPVVWLVIHQRLRLTGRGHDASETRRAEQRKTALGVLARRALESADGLAMIEEAMELVRETLGTANCITNRRLASGEIRNVAIAGDVVAVQHPARASVADRVHAADVSEPVISNDLPAESRFSVPATVLERRHVPWPQRPSRRALWVVATRSSLNAARDDRPFTDGRWPASSRRSPT